MNTNSEDLRSKCLHPSGSVRHIRTDDFTSAVWSVWRDGNLWQLGPDGPDNKKSAVHLSRLLRNFWSSTNFENRSIILDVGKSILRGHLQRASMNLLTTNSLSYEKLTTQRCPAVHLPALLSYGMTRKIIECWNSYVCH
jgi:hypothetical protein